MYQLLAPDGKQPDSGQSDSRKTKKNGAREPPIRTGTGELYKGNPPRSNGAASHTPDRDCLAGETRSVADLSLANTGSNRKYLQLEGHLKSLVCLTPIAVFGGGLKQIQSGGSRWSTCSCLERDRVVDSPGGGRVLLSAAVDLVQDINIGFSLTN